MKAVSKILQRSERQTMDKLLVTYVDIGILAQLHNANNQIVYGRRGTGKTHVLKVVASELADDPSQAVAYIDARTLGSTSQFSDTSLSLERRCIALFRDILSEIYNALLEYVIVFGPENGTEILELLDEFGRTATEGITTRNLISEEAREGTSQTGGGTVEFGMDGAGPGLSFTGETTASEEAVRRTETRVEYEDKVTFPSVKNTLGKLLGRLESQLFILIDEWSSIPFEIQPHLAEFIKRGFLPDPTVVTKIASLEYRSNFGERRNHDFLGFELGSDIATALDIDDYFVYDRNPDAVTSAFREMLFLHIKSELPDAYAEGALKVSTSEQFARRLFTEPGTFEELVRASEGVPRDMINIFTTAYFDAHRRSRDNIDRKAVVEAARQWFEKDKAQNLEDDLQEVLRRIVDEVIGHRRARSFLIPRELERHPVIRRLFDSRVLHLMQRGYADKDNPGLRYNIYTLDYGTYVDLLNTKKEPQVEMEEITGPTEELVVPFDDKRSIRRITLSEEILTV